MIPHLAPIIAFLPIALKVLHQISSLSFSMCNKARKSHSQLHVICIIYFLLGEINVSHFAKSICNRNVLDTTFSISAVMNSKSDSTRCQKFYLTMKPGHPLCKPTTTYRQLYLKQTSGNIAHSTPVLENQSFYIGSVDSWFAASSKLNSKFAHATNCQL